MGNFIRISGDLSKGLTDFICSAGWYFYENGKLKREGDVYYTDNRVSHFRY